MRGVHFVLALALLAPALSPFGMLFTLWSLGFLVHRGDVRTPVSRALVQM